MVDGSPERRTILEANARFMRAFFEGETPQSDDVKIMRDLSYSYPIADELEHPTVFRRRMLLRIVEKSYPREFLSNAAKLIAKEWRTHVDGMGGEELPGSAAEFYARLGRAGIKPVEWRQIYKDLTGQS